jgi:hypothetical protein
MTAATWTTKRRYHQLHPVRRRFCSLVPVRGKKTANLSKAENTPQKHRRTGDCSALGKEARAAIPLAARRGSRNKLSEQFFEELCADWQNGGTIKQALSVLTVPQLCGGIAVASSRLCGISKMITAFANRRETRSANSGPGHLGLREAMAAGAWRTECVRRPSPRRYRAAALRQAV